MINQFYILAITIRHFSVCVLGVGVMLSRSYISPELPILYFPIVLLYVQQSGRSPKVVALFSATNSSSNITELRQLRDTIQI